MMTDGGPAFPRMSGTTEMGGSMGMSLRDWFAGQALAGLLARSTAYSTPSAFVPEAYLFADAMLKAREAK